MRSTIYAGLIGLAVSLALPSGVLGADAVTKCGVAQLKALRTVFKAFTAEGTRACVAGAAGNPQPVDLATLTAVTDKVNAELQAAIDKYGAASCFQKSLFVAANIANLASDVANQLCLVPPPAP